MANHTNARMTYEMDSYSGENWMIAVVKFATETGERIGFITTDHVHSDEFTHGDPEADLRLWSSAAALLEACEATEAAHQQLVAADGADVSDEERDDLFSDAIRSSVLAWEMRTAAIAKARGIHAHQ